jgi:hypothetical protein
LQLSALERHPPLALLVQPELASRGQQQPASESRATVPLVKVFNPSLKFILPHFFGLKKLQNQCHACGMKCQKVTQKNTYRFFPPSLLLLGLLRLSLHLHAHFL